MVRHKDMPILSRYFPTKEAAETWAAWVEEQIARSDSVIYTDDRGERRWIFPPMPLALDLYDEDISVASVPYTRHSGVYFLLLEGTVVYVGRTNHLLRRCPQHEGEGRKFDRVAFMPCPEERAAEIEQLYIWRLQPALNAKHTMGENEAARDRIRQRFPVEPEAPLNKG